MNAPSIRPAKLAEAIAAHLRQMILEGVLQPGERLLSERELSARLDVSRPSLREALDKLIEMGLLTTNAQGVAHVSHEIGKSMRDPLAQLMETPEARIDFLELRSILEASAAALAAQRASPVDLDAIHDCFDAMVAAHEAHDVDAIARTDAEFHLAIYEASHNLMLLHLMRSLEGLLRSNVTLNRRNLYEKRLQKESQLAEHRAIHDAVMARDAEAARQAASLHMTTAMRTQREIYEAELRMEASIRRLGRSGLVAGPRARKAKP